eukprot:878809-Amphidinium_carterae.2
MEIENTAPQPQLRVMNPDDPDGLQPRHCCYAGCAVLGEVLCEHRGCNRHACAAHSFSIFLPDGALAAKWCSAHRRPAVSNKYMSMRKKVCCKCGSDSGIIARMLNCTLSSLVREDAHEWKLPNLFTLTVYFGFGRQVRCHDYNNCTSGYNSAVDCE